MVTTIQQKISIKDMGILSYEQSCTLDERYLYAAVRYVENNPVRAKIVEKSHDYKWSSARSHIYKETDPVLSGDCYLTEQIQDWLRYLEEREDDVLINTIRSN